MFVFGEYGVVGFETVLLKHGGIADDIVLERGSLSRTENNLRLPFALDVYGDVSVCVSTE